MKLLLLLLSLCFISNLNNAQTNTYDAAKIEERLVSKLYSIQLQIYDAVLRMKIPAYSDLKLKQKMNQAELQVAGSYEQTIQVYHDQDDNYFSIDSIVHVTFNPKSDFGGICSYFYTYYDIDNEILLKKIDAHALTFKYLNRDSTVRPLFYLKHSDLFLILNNEDKRFLTVLSTAMIGNNISGSGKKENSGSIVINKDKIEEHILTSKNESSLIDKAVMKPISNSLMNDCLNTLFYIPSGPDGYYHNASCTKKYSKDEEKLFMKNDTMLDYSNPNEPYNINESITYTRIKGAISNFGISDLDELSIGSESIGMKFSDKFLKTKPVTVYVKKEDFARRSYFLTYYILMHL